MSASVTIDLTGIDAKFSAEATENARALLCERVLEDSNRYCMQETGALLGSGDFTDSQVMWTVDYAKYAYNADRALTDVNPNATPQWFETAKQSHLEEWREYIKGELS